MSTYQKNNDCSPNRKAGLLKETDDDKFVIPIIYIQVSHNKLPQILAWIYLNQQNETSLFQIAEFVFTHKRIAKTLLLPRNQAVSVVKLTLTEAVT